jgi:hypothetical protein
MRATLLVLGVLLLLPAGCRNETTDSDAGIPASPDGSIDGAVPEEVCLALAAPCTPGVAPACCAGICREDGSGAAVCSQVDVCGADGAACTSPTDCCSLQCSAGRCSALECLQLGTACAAATECCSGTCTAGLCAALPGATCGTLGEACGDDAGCCSQNCVAGRCAGASSCSAAGDLCYEALDCCNGGCNLPIGGGPGTCALSVSAAGSPNCTVAGEPCVGDTGCCSRTCLDLGSGKSTCVLGSGCRQTGEICSKSTDCCGWDTSRVVCSLAFTDPPVGRCANGVACQPVGNCCGLFGSNCPQDCCDGKKAVCRLDISGLSRCFGGGAVCPNGYDGLDPECCIADGEECEFRDQCCDLAPCVQVDGRYVCQSPQCAAAGSPCVPGATGAGACCNGLSCLSSGELGGLVCRTSTTPGAGGADAGVVLDAGQACLENGASCSSADACCSGACIAGACGSCRTDGLACASGAECCSGSCAAGTCVAPQTCVNQGGICSGTAECCPGFSCSIPAGQANGSCQPGATCSASGQICSSAQSCCSGLRCTNLSTGTTCAEGDARCACRVVLN